MLLVLYPHYDTGPTNLVILNRGSLLIRGRMVVTFLGKHLATKLVKMLRGVSFPPLPMLLNSLVTFITRTVRLLRFAPSVNLWVMHLLT